jgi:hypothetical protein
MPTMSEDFYFVVLDHEPSRWERLKWRLRVKLGWRPPDDMP